MAYAFDPKDDVETQWQKWSAQFVEPPILTDEALRENIIRDLTFVSGMDVKEYTLYQKWCEVQEKYPSVVVNDLWEGEKRVLEDEGQRLAIEEIKRNFWIPETPDDYLSLQPEMLYTSKQEDLPELWNCIRTFSSTMKNNSNIGRNLNFVVRGPITASDFMWLFPVIDDPG